MFSPLQQTSPGLQKSVKYSLISSTVWILVSFLSISVWSTQLFSETVFALKAIQHLCIKFEVISNSISSHVICLGWGCKLCKHYLDSPTLCKEHCNNTKTGSWLCFNTCGHQQFTTMKKTTSPLLILCCITSKSHLLNIFLLDNTSECYPPLV